MKKRIQAVVMSIVLILSVSLSSVGFANENITVKLNGKTLSFDVPPQIINGRTMVPMRKIFEELGATVEWEQETQTITSVKGDTTIKLTIGVPSIKINQQIPRELDSAPCIVNGRTLVPVRAISEAFYMNVDWDGTTQTVLITPPNVNMASYNKLKNSILAKGEKSSLDESYSIYYKPRDKKYSLMINYETKFDFISLYFNFEEEDYEDTVMILIYPDMNPSLYHEEVFSSGYEYELHANYPKANQPFVETSNTFPQDLAPYEVINVSMELMDIIMQDLLDMSFADFGLYYEK